MSLIQRLQQKFDRELNGTGPLGVAVSGGGDSVALLYGLAAWQKRPLEVFCVDHGLNPASPDWTQGVADHAARLGLGFTALAWRGDKPQTGISAAARLARHGLLADAARQKGVKTLCLAHTRDDLAEAALMQAAGSNVGSPQVWAPSPVWPQGRGIWLYRPCLDIRREDLRQYLLETGVGWIDDPANESAKSLRAQVRKRLPAQLPEIKPDPMRLNLPQLRELLTDKSLAHYGVISFRSRIFHALPREMALNALAAAAVSAGGGDKLPRRHRLEALYGQLTNQKPATLSGARVQQTDDVIRIGREAGEFRRHFSSEGMEMPHLSLQAGETGVWDGRFEITASEPCEIIASSGVRQDLSDTDQRTLLALPPDVRMSLAVAVTTRENPKQNKVLIKPQGGNTALRQTPYTSVAIRALVLARFLHATAVIAYERDHDDLDALSSSEMT